MAIFAVNITSVTNMKEEVKSNASRYGLIAAVILMSGSLLGMFGIIPTNKVMMFFGPLVALNELTLSIWLIAKGFNPQLMAAEKI